MSKQDRQAVRNAVDLERKYNLGSNAAMKTAKNARNIAIRASADVAALDAVLNQAGVLARLTNGGKAPAIYLGEDGQLYVRVDYIRGLVTEALDAMISFRTESAHVLSIGGKKGGVPFLQLGEAEGKTLSWKDNEDGTYTLIGT